MLNRLRRLAPKFRASPPSLEELSRQKEYPVLDFTGLVHLLGLENRIRSIRRLAGVDRESFDRLYQPALNRYLESAQLQPASMADHHAGLGGLIVHTLEVVELSMKARRQLLLPENSAPEIIRREEHCWTYAVFVAALLHDAGKLLTLTRLRLNTGQSWTGAGGDLAHTGATHYQIEHVGERYSLQTRVSVMLFGAFVPSIGQDMLVQNARALGQLTGWLSSDDYEWGVLGKIVRQADSQSVAQNLAPGTRLEQLPNAPTRPVVDRITRALRSSIVDGEIQFNRSGAAGWADADHVYLVCRTAADMVRQRLATTGAHDIPHDNTRLFDLWQDHGYLVPTEQGKAVWHVRIRTEAFDHTLTVLKFERSLLIHPSRQIAPFDGTIESVEGESADESPEGDLADPVERVPTRAQEPSSANNDATASDAAGKASTPPAQPTKNTPTEGGELAPLEELNASLQRAATAHNSVPYGPPVALDHGDIGLYFLTWLRDSVADKHLKLNEKDALVHTLKGYVAVVSPKIFHRFLTTAKLVSAEDRQTLDKGAKRVQNRLRKTAHVIIPGANGYSVRTLQVITKSTKSSLKVFIFEQHVVFPEGNAPEPNPILAFSD